MYIHYERNHQYALFTQLRNVKKSSTMYMYYLIFQYIHVFMVYFQSVGALESDYPVDEEILKAESFPQYKPPPSSTSNDNAQADNSGIGGITFVQCATGNNSQPTSPQVSPVGSYKSTGNYRRST